MYGDVIFMVWLEWVEDIASAHWEAVAAPDLIARYVWFVTRHEIDYRGYIAQVDTVTARTYFPGPPQGARFVRCVDVADAAGSKLVSGRSTWAMIDRASGRPMRITPEVSGPFLTSD